jgi:hypothetical protein
MSIWWEGWYRVPIVSGIQLGHKLPMKYRVEQAMHTDDRQLWLVETMLGIPLTKFSAIYVKSNVAI